MAGHSKWSKIRHKKAINDAKRGKAFSKLLQQITSAVRDGGPDPDANPTLRLLMDKAKSVSLPKSNLERAIQRGAGVTKDGRKLETIYYEGYSGDGIGVIVEAITDNNNRTVSELRTIFSKHGGNLADTGSVSWNFDQVGRILIASGYMQPSEKYGEDDVFVAVEPDEVIETLFEADGVEDIGDPYDVDGRMYIEIITDPKMLNSVRQFVEDHKWIIEEIGLTRLVKNAKEASDSALEKLGSLVDDLEAHDDVQRVWTEVR